MLANCLAAPTKSNSRHMPATAVQVSQVVPDSIFWSSLSASHWCTCIADECMQLVCKLTQLQSLELHNMATVTAAGLAGLHNLPALKRLGLEDLCCEISASAVPTFPQLTALTCLKLGWTIDRPRGEFDPSVLAHMTRLKELHLDGVDPAGGASGAAELLSKLAQLTKLQVLHLAWVYYFLQCPPAAFSSLTSSSVLRSLTWWDYFGWVVGQSLRLEQDTQDQLVWGILLYVPLLPVLVSSGHK